MYASLQADTLVILEDFSDWLNTKYTSTILHLLSGITMATVYVVRPISCDIQTFPNNDPGYAESVCWNQGTMIWEKISEENGSQRKTDICRFILLKALPSYQRWWWYNVVTFSLLPVGSVLSLDSGDPFLFAPFNLAYTTELVLRIQPRLTD